MRKAAFFGFLLAVYYLAAMYRSQPLTALCLGMLLLAGAAFFQARQVGKGLSASFPQGRGDAVQGREARLPIRLESRRPLRAGRCILTLEAGYGPGEDLPAARLEAPVRAGENRLEAVLLPPCCGLLLLRITALEGRDWFSLFRSKKRWSAEAVLAVFPPPEALNIVLSPIGGRAAALSAGQPKREPGEDTHEIRQLREYRIGDQTRRIHWNLSARTGKLWLKEPEGEEAPSASLSLLWGENALSPQEQSDFFRLFHALALGLLARFSKLEIAWRDGEGRRVCGEASGGEEIRRLLLSLYRLGAEGFPAVPPLPEDRQGSFVLDTELGWYWEETLIHRFSPAGLEQEMREKTFWL